MKTIKILIILFIASVSLQTQLNAQQKESLAILNLDAINTFYKGKEITRLLRSEVTKLDKYSVKDGYEMREAFQSKKFNDSTCFSKSCGVAAGIILNVDYVIVGSVERFGPKIIVTLNLIKVSDETVLKQIVHDFISKEDEIQRILRISAQEILSAEVDSQLSSELSYIELPVSNPNNLINLNGPRMGIAFVTGSNASILTSNSDDGGFEMLGTKDLAITTVMGYQWEKRYIATHNFQALIEGVVLVSGMEVGRFNPSFAFLNGLRFSKSNWEFGFGPTLKFTKKAEGYYKDGKWNLKNDWNVTDTSGFIVPNPYKIEQKLDSRGTTKAYISMVFAVGKTFQSGRLNMPVNIYYTPNREGSTIGLSVGFNIQKNN